VLISFMNNFVTVKIMPVRSEKNTEISLKNNTLTPQDSQL